MGTEKNGTGAGTTGTEAAATEAKRTRKSRPIWLMIPVKGTKSYDLFKCEGTGEARKLLQEQGIDTTDERFAGIVALRGDVLPLKVSSQVVIKFGKAGDEADAEDSADQ